MLDSLRQPIETGRAVISRANRHVTYPARFQLVAAMNPCRCGYLADPARACAQTPRCAESYQARLSGPLLDRFDLAIKVAAVAIDDLSAPPRWRGRRPSPPASPPPAPAKVPAATACATPVSMGRR